MKKFHITVDADGRQAAWNGEEFVGDASVVEKAVKACQLGADIPVFGMFDMTPDANTPLGATAALFAYSPGRTHITLAPQEVIDYFNHAFATRDCGRLAS